MKTDNKTLVKELAELKVLQTEPIKHQTQNDITVTNSNGESCRVITDNISDEDLPILIQTKQLKTLNAIKNMITFYTVLTVIGLIAAIIWVLFF